MSVIAHTAMSLGLVCACVLAGCATLPDTDALIAQHSTQAQHTSDAALPLIGCMQQPPTAWHTHLALPLHSLMVCTLPLQHAPKHMPPDAAAPPA